MQGVTHYLLLLDICKLIPISPRILSIGLHSFLQIAGYNQNELLQRSYLLTKYDPYPTPIQGVQLNCYIMMF